MIITVKIVFTVATLLFARGLWIRPKTASTHGYWMLGGLCATLGTAVVLIVGVNVYGATYSPASWLVSMAGDHAKWVLLIHRGISTLTFVLLLIQGWAGWRRHPLHLRLYKIVIPLWLTSYLSGLTIFV